MFWKESSSNKVENKTIPPAHMICEQQYGAGRFSGNLSCGSLKIDFPDFSPEKQAKEKEKRKREEPVN